MHYPILNFTPHRLRIRTVSGAILEIPSRGTLRAKVEGSLPNPGFTINGIPIYPTPKVGDVDTHPDEMGLVNDDIGSILVVSEYCAKAIVGAPRGNPWKAFAVMTPVQQPGHCTRDEAGNIDVIFGLHYWGGAGILSDAERG